MKTLDLSAESLSTFRRVLDSSRRICFLTGAGVSTNAGLGDFQSLDSSWKYPIPREEAMSVAYFRSNPESFWEIYADIFKPDSTLELTPTPFHRWITELSKGESESEDGERQSKLISVVTQNVDGLHTKANNPNIEEVHGTIATLLCSFGRCKRVVDYKDYPYTGNPPRCPECDHILRPNIVLFGENLNDDQKAMIEVMNADVLIVAGTSLTVSPVNMFPIIKNRKYPSDYQYYIGADVTETIEKYPFDQIFKGDTDELAKLMMTL